MLALIRYYCPSTGFRDRAVTFKDPGKEKLHPWYNLNPGYKLELHQKFGLDLINYHNSAQGTFSRAFIFTSLTFQ